MSRTHRMLSAVGMAPLAHRPPLSRRLWIYCAAAYLIPVIAAFVLPRSGPYDDLVWLITLAPAFLLALHYGLKGALVGLLMGTALFITVEAVITANLMRGNWTITIAIYVAYGVLATSVGWLSQQLHDHYHEALGSARMAAIGQVAVTIRHEVNNALTTIVAESMLLLDKNAAPLTPDQQASIRAMHESAMRISADIRKLTALEKAPVKEYLPGMNMVDLKSAPDSVTR